RDRYLYEYTSYPSRSRTDFSIVNSKKFRRPQCFMINAVDARCRYKCLNFPLDGIYQVRLAAFIQLAQYVIEKQYRVFTNFVMSQVNFRQLQRQSGCSLLSL